MPACVRAYEMEILFLRPNAQVIYLQTRENAFFSRLEVG